MSRRGAAMRRPAGSWSNDQLSSAFTAPAARLSSRTVQQSQKWSPELPYSSRTGPAQQRADERQKAATSPAQPRLQGQKISQGVIKGYRGGRRRPLAARLAAHPGVGGRRPGERPPPCTAARLCRPPGVGGMPGRLADPGVRHIRTCATYVVSLPIPMLNPSGWVNARNLHHLPGALAPAHGRMGVSHTPEICRS